MPTPPRTTMIARLCCWMQRIGGLLRRFYGATSLPLRVHSLAMRRGERRWGVLSPLFLLSAEEEQGQEEAAVAEVAKLLKVVMRSMSRRLSIRRCGGVQDVARQTIAQENAKLPHGQSIEKFVARLLKKWAS